MRTPDELVEIHGAALGRAVGWAIQVPMSRGSGWLTTYARFASEDAAADFARWNHPRGLWRIVPPDDCISVHKIGPCGCGAVHKGAESITLNGWSLNN